MFSFQYLIITTWVLLSTFGAIAGLKCYSCNVSTSNLDDDVCKGIGSLTECNADSICLSATYRVTDHSVRTYTTVRTCFLKSNGQECDIFYNAQKGLRKAGVDMKMENCFNCDKDDCNRFSYQKSGGIQYMPSIFLVSLIAILFIAL